jgi:hypothetical protein
MEHRCGERFTVDLPAIVHSAAGECVAVTLRNLGNGGAFVAVPRHRAFLRGLVELEFHVPGTNPGDYLWRAWVLRQEADGVALMFDDHQRSSRLPFLASRLAGVRPRARAGQSDQP